MRLPKVNYPHTVQVETIAEARYVEAFLNDAAEVAKESADLLLTYIDTYTERHPDATDPLVTSGTMMSMEYAQVWVPGAVNMIVFFGGMSKGMIALVNNRSVAFDERFQCAHRLIGYAHVTIQIVMSIGAMMQAMQDALGIERDLPDLKSTGTSIRRTKRAPTA